MAIILYPSRTLHNRDKGADVQQGPVLRFLFLLRPSVNLFNLLLFYTLLACKMSKKDIGIIYKHTARRTKVDVIEAAQFVLCFQRYALTIRALSPQ